MFNIKHDHLLNNSVSTVNSLSYFPVNLYVTCSGIRAKCPQATNVLCPSLKTEGNENECI